jgi:DNA invertase Pin-like site-specific DNA recombinase
MIVTESPRPLKIESHHLDRLAVVYVRQSHPDQARRHPESPECQANLKQKAIDWGWPADRVLVLLGDQGKSATTTEGRETFAWLLSEITLSHVGLLLSFQINRLAREDEACARLFKVCKLFDTLIADMDGIYHPNDFNDCLVLTIKGIVGGIELHQIQQRMQTGRLNKVRRGEWLGTAPPGFVVGRDSKLAQDPDEQVRAAVHLLFDEFNRQGSISGLLRWMHAHQQCIPFRSYARETKGEIQWRPAHRETLRNILRHPVYCGIHAWGRRTTDPKRAIPGRRGTGRVSLKPEDCAVWIPENHPGYITPEQYEANIRRIETSTCRGPKPSSAAKQVALLNGLVVCGHCDRVMQTRYTRVLRYDCQAKSFDYGAPRCQSFVGESLDELVAAQVLQAIQPASLELSLKAAQQLERQRAELEHVWQLRLERARQEVDRAWRQYNAVEPENRLVARTLEHHWEQALLSLRDLQEEHDRFCQEQPFRLSDADRAAVESLAMNLPAVWNSSRTSLLDKRQVVRLLLEAVKVWAPRDSNLMTVHCHWTHGSVTKHEIRRRVGKWEHLADYEVLLSRLKTLQASGRDWSAIAEALNQEGFRSPQSTAITAANLRQLWSRRNRSEQTPRKPK